MPARMQPARMARWPAVPASTGTVTARARVVLDPVGAHLEPGEILVAPSTDPGWTPLFLTAGGLVMEMGGSNSHGAVVAREYGIPAVVGVPEATHKIETGQLITVDGAAGLVAFPASHSRFDSPRPVLSSDRVLARAECAIRVYLRLTAAPRARAFRRFRMSVQGREDPLGYFVDLAEAVHLDEQATRAVDLEERRGLIGVDLQAYSDGFLVVVGAAIDLCPSAAAARRLLRCRPGVR